MKWIAVTKDDRVWDTVEADSYDEAYYKFQEIKRNEDADDYAFIRKAENENENE